MRIIVIGGGMRGAAITAFISASGLADVILVESLSIGSGASSANHGRFHVGTWNYKENKNSEIIEINKESYNLLSKIPQATDSTKWAYYCFEKESLANEFIKFCENHKIFYNFIEKESINKGWCNVDLIEVGIKIPEFSFNPARLAARLVEASIKLRNGRNCTVYEAEAQRIDFKNDIFEVTLSNGKSIEADYVINSMNNWFGTIESELPLPKPKIQLQSWELLCFLRSEFEAPPLDYVLTIQTEDERFLGLLPHEDWIVFGCDVKRYPVTSEKQIREKLTLRSFNNKVNNEQYILNIHQKYIPVLHGNPEPYLRTFSGVYSEKKEIIDGNQGVVTPYSAHCIYKSKNVERYLLVFGGSATSALSDATKVFKTVFSDSRYERLDYYIELLRKIVVNIPDRDFGEGMSWERGSK